MKKPSIKQKILNKLKTPELHPGFYEKHINISKNVLTKGATNLLISRSIESGKAFHMARLGCVEANAMLAIERFEKGKFSEKILELYRSRTFNIWKTDPIKSLEKNAGFFNPTKELLKKYLQLMKDSVNQLDLLGSWTEPETRYTSHLPELPTCELSSLEPYFQNNPWTKALEGKKVLVIHPFAELIKKQYKENRHKLFPGKDILPDFSLTTIEAVQTQANAADTRFKNWFDALNWMQEEALNRDFDVAIIGCGAYGFPLGAHLKKHGKQSIHLGGATQIMFGIKGRRWDEREEFRVLYNKYWRRPGKREKPIGYETVEDGCYW